MAKSRNLTMLSSAAIATLLATAVVTPVHAETGDMYNTSSKTKYSINEYLLDNAKFDSLINDLINNIDSFVMEYEGKGYNFAKLNSKLAELRKGGKTFAEARTAAYSDTTLQEGIPNFEEALKIQTNAITDTKLNVKLSKAIDEAKAENFKIEGMTVLSATLSEDKKEVKLDVQGAKVNAEYTVKATGLKVDGKVIDDVTCTFKMPSAESLFTPEVTFGTDKLKADGQATTLVTFTLKDSNGNVMTDADKVEVAFTTTFGTFAEKRVTVQNGIATVLLTSETLDAVKTATVTATVVEAANNNLYGLGAKRNIVMDPNPDSGEQETAGATMTEVQAAQADRVIVYFNKEVQVSDYVKEGTHELDRTNKADAKVYTNVSNADANDTAAVPGSGTAINVVGVLPVSGNDKALQLILDTTTPPLVDNANLKVLFTDKTGTLDVASARSCKLTDARKPAMLSVAREGLKTLKVTFSESVERTSAQSPENWVIDGFALDNAVYGVDAKAEIGEFNPTTGDDTRNVVTITLGKDAKGNQVYFKSGTHSIQGSSIGDWANLSDVNNNVMNTQTLDFSIPVDSTAPNAKVEVQSPEQYIVTFDKEVSGVNGNIKDKIVLQKFNKDKNEWEKETKQTIEVTPIDGTNEYKVQTKKDWTDDSVYNTSANHLNYYNDSYRLFVAKDTVVSASNGVKNADIALLLEGAMKNPDVTSPIINTISEIRDDAKVVTGYKVTMSEPVKGFDEVGDTLAQGQTKVTPTAQFISKDATKTINATVTKGADAYDKQITVTPEEALEPGDWTLVVRSIADDIGNTAASATKDFTVIGDKPAEEGKFAAVWAFADTDADLDVDTAYDKTSPDHADTTGKDYVYVKFNKAVSITGDAKNALKTSNFQLDGMPLPTGTQIKANIAGLDNVDAVTDSITIELPDGYLNKINEPHVLNISSYLESTTAGDVLTNGGVKKLTWSADTEAEFNAAFTAEGLVYALEQAIATDITNVQSKLTAATTAVEAIDNDVLAKTTLVARLEAAKKTIDASKDAIGAFAKGYAEVKVNGNVFEATVDADKESAKLKDILTSDEVKNVIDSYNLTAATITNVKNDIETVTGKALADVTLADLKGKTITVGSYTLEVK